MNIKDTTTKTHDKVMLYAKRHISSCEHWQHGFPVRCWHDGSGVLCIEYESGRYWHYRNTGHGVEWW